MLAVQIMIVATDAGSLYREVADYHGICCHLIDKSRFAVMIADAI